MSDLKEQLRASVVLGQALHSAKTLRKHAVELRRMAVLLELEAETLEAAATPQEKPVFAR